MLPDNYLLELDVGLPCYFQHMEGMCFLLGSFPEFSVDRIFAVTRWLIPCGAGKMYAPAC